MPLHATFRRDGFRRHHAIVLALTVPLALASAAVACGPDPAPDPCDDDPFGCAASPGLDYLESCSRDDDLVIEVGHGEDEFISFDVAEPVIHSGGQGGQHVFGAIRIASTAPELYDQVQFTLTLYVPLRADCADDSFRTDDGRCWYEITSRTVLLEGNDAVPDDSGVIEQHGIVLVGFGFGDEVAVRATAEDPCRRSGEAVGY